MAYQLTGIAPIVTKTSGYTLTDADGVVLGDTTGGAFTLTLPTAVGRTGKVFTIVNLGVSNLTIGTTSAQTISGSTTKVITNKYNALTLISNGANWFLN